MTTWKCSSCDKPCTLIRNCNPTSDPQVIAHGNNSQRLMTYLTVAEYAASKRVTSRTLRAEIKKGRIKAEKIGKEYRVPVEA